MTALIADDNYYNRELLYQICDIYKYGYKKFEKIEVASTPIEAAEKIVDLKPDIVFLDIRYNDPTHEYTKLFTGYDVFNYVKDFPECYKTVIIFITGEYKKSLVKSNLPSDYPDDLIVIKPVNLFSLQEIINKYVKQPIY